MNNNFFEKLYDAEYTKTFTKEGGIERYKTLVKMFAKEATMEMSIIVDTAGEILHDKYGMDWDEIEAVEIAAY